MERETGFEPATSTLESAPYVIEKSSMPGGTFIPTSVRRALMGNSLGRRLSIANKRTWRFCRPLSGDRVQPVFILSFRAALNSVQTVFKMVFAFLSALKVASIGKRSPARANSEMSNVIAGVRKESNEGGLVREAGACS
jgi:hypothetical protein